MRVEGFAVTQGSHTPMETTEDKFKRSRANVLHYRKKFVLFRFCSS